MSVFPNYTWQLYEHIHVVHRNLLDLLAAYLLKNRTRLRQRFDYSVIHTWGTDKSNAVIGGVTVPQTWREHLPENGT